MICSHTIAAEVIIVFLLVNLVKITSNFSYEIEAKFLYQLDRGCKNIDIRFHVGYLEKLKNCKSVHGFLRISDMEIPIDFQNLTFSDLEEITGYFLMDSVAGLQSLSTLFPKLKSIGGELLYHGCAFVITNNADLEIGLKSLISIGNGNVCVENNAKLSFVKTIDWNRLRQNISVISKNNSNEMIACASDFCWGNDVSQTICDYSMKNSDECSLCSKLVLIKEDDIVCTDHEILAFELENRFLVNAETCDQMGRTRLDDQCLRRDECPIDEGHFYNISQNACLFSPSSLKNCSIVIKSRKDLYDFSIFDCNIANRFEISNVEDSLEFDVQKMIDEKLQYLVEIKGCLIVRNSSAIDSLAFLKRLRKISGSCTEGDETFSVLIADNRNLHTFIPSKFGSAIKNHGRIIVRNSENLCYEQLNLAKTVFKNLTEADIQEDECLIGNLNIKVIVRNDSALILFDTALVKSFKFTLKLWSSFMEQSIEVVNNHCEVKNLTADTVYAFKFEALNENGIKIFDSKYYFMETLKSNQFLAEHYLKEIESHKISLEFPEMHDLRNNEVEDYNLYATYKSMDEVYCSNVTEIEVKSDNWFDKDTRPFHQYFPKDPRSMVDDFNKTRHQIFPYKSQITLSNLTDQTCYKIEVYPCIMTNGMFCYSSKTIASKTAAENVLKPFSSDFDLVDRKIAFDAEIIKISENAAVDSSKKFVSIIITVSVVIIAIPVMFFYTYKIYTKIQVQPPTAEIEMAERKTKDEFEVDRENIVMSKVIGKGEFGVVYRGFIKPNEDTFYAIKKLSELNECYEDNFLKEAQFMRKFRAHHVVKLIGYCTSGKPLLVIMELMVHGDLKKFLQNNRPTEKRPETKLASSSYTTAPAVKKPLHPIRPVAEMAIEIADGMMYLENMKFIHCDLACRNCMVHESYTIKIGDFGMARELYHSDYYKPGSRNKKIPLRWMSPEALGSDTIMARYTSKSDVFSFGIVLYELVTYCEKPYASYGDDQVIQMIKSGITMEAPKDCDEKISELMAKCWRFNPDERATFKEIIEFLSSHFVIRDSFKDVSFYHNGTLD